LVPASDSHVALVVYLSDNTGMVYEEYLPRASNSKNIADKYVQRRISRKATGKVGPRPSKNKK
jgi:hypothetical protein